MGQLSFFSAEARAPRVGDLAGLLCGPGRALGFARGRAARVSVALDEPGRGPALVSAMAERGVEARVGTCAEKGNPEVTTAFRTDLTGLAGQWLRSGTKVVPDDFAPDGGVLRLWALAAGRWVESGYVLGLDPDAPDTHEPLRKALATAGLPATLSAPKAGGPALRVNGRRRLERLAELVGRAPTGVTGRTWPAA
ncbi:hypothetical protein GCM10022243_66020 [Saccharothrix violaceirubra]|uniref:Uncharacterized protein n=1 Tax=Saccharothrix violaceirubra TaxID=413306 RepID=A0A7W7WZJ2_9PSEU|nr:hypothetical protein [Saccharothrix violaceirubra]MBB4968913.1 hypothetical protein [Saccharothrix violaceirubra]